MNKSDTSKERMKTLESMSRFCMVLANVNESDMQCDENRSNTGCNRPVIWAILIENVFMRFLTCFST